MFNKLADIKKRYEFLSEKLSDNAVIADMGTPAKHPITISGSRKKNIGCAHSIKTSPEW